MVITVHGNQGSGSTGDFNQVNPELGWRCPPIHSKLGGSSRRTIQDQSRSPGIGRLKISWLGFPRRKECALIQTTGKPTTRKQEDDKWPLCSAPKQMKQSAITEIAFVIKRILSHLYSNFVLSSFSRKSKK